MLNAGWQCVLRSCGGTCQEDSGSKNRQRFYTLIGMEDARDTGRCLHDESVLWQGRTWLVLHPMYITVRIHCNKKR